MKGIKILSLSLAFIHKAACLKKKKKKLNRKQNNEESCVFFQLSTSFKHFQILQLFRWNDFESTSDLLKCIVLTKFVTRCAHNCVTIASQ